jgi:hypothetical protein
MFHLFLKFFSCYYYNNKVHYNSVITVFFVDKILILLPKFSVIWTTFATN